jgi:hypothetical protein
MFRFLSNKHKRLLITSGLAVALCQFSANTSFAGNKPKIDLSFDLDSAEAMISVLNRGEIKPDELRSLTKLPGIEAIIRQASRFDSNASEDSFKESLLRILSGKPLAADPFRFKLVEERLKEIESLYQYLKKDPERFKTGLIERIAPYSPEDLSFKVDVVFVVGGSSDAWATEGKFYVDLRYFGDDYEGLELIMSHELYHTAQDQFYGSVVETGSQQFVQVQRLLENTRNEGMASLVGDPTNSRSKKAYSEWFRAKFDRNLLRIRQDFALFDTILFRLDQDNGFTFNEVYSIGFSGGWDSPLYFVGYYIGKAIENYKGRKYLVETLKKPPSEFFRAYIELYREKEGDDLVMFGDAIEEIILRPRTTA